jgi:anti-sigma-K factor RskA
MNDVRHEELACLHALDLLEGEERKAFEAAAQDDDALRQLVDDLRETGAAIGLTAPAAEPSPFLRERVLASAAQRRAGRRSGFSLNRFLAPRWAVAAGFALVVATLGWQNWRLENELEVQRSAAATAEKAAEGAQRSAAALEERWQRDRAQASEVIAALRRQADVAELKVASLASLLGPSPEAQAIAVWNPLTQEGVLTVVNLPALESDKDYQLWLIDPQYDIPVDGGVFRVDPATGEARVTFRPDRPVRVVDKFAVSLEREGGVPKAEGPMVLISP